ncbi:B3/4 domain-containing protein [Lacticaseibacillus baoqingensis]|uniref:B3/4 domain-containing protein n=1 Tax=Lacticaseibacillus baoqingensis TaxID=2486013 RepID=A0ABW4E9Q7_9LACO|nr:phenylalanine--tRNA ligase beta subunit-related protein [Lacticaseibacillus baoqingensis]
MEFSIDPQIQGGLALTMLEFINHDECPALWQEKLTPLLAQIAAHDDLATLRADPAIQATKAAYKAVGKDPSRYRPSSDSLWRRVINHKGLYHVNALVDLNNALSLQLHLPIGSYDQAQLTPPLRYTVAEAGASYPGIGKAAIDLSQGLVLADAKGYFGSPTADSNRAMITGNTRQALMVVYLFGACDPEAIQQLVANQAQHYLDQAQVLQQAVIWP